MYKILFLFFIMILETHALQASEIISLDYNEGPPASSIQKEGQVFLTLDGTIYLGIDINTYKSFENKIGPFKAKSSSNIRDIPLDKFPSWPFKKEEEVSFYNPFSDKIEKYPFGKIVKLKLVPSPYYQEGEDNYFYNSFNLVLAKEALRKPFSKKDEHSYNGIALKGVSLELNPRVLALTEFTPVPKFTADVKKLVELHKKKTSGPLKEKDLIVKYAKLGERKLFQISNLHNSFTSNFLETSTTTYLYWPEPSDLEMTRFQMYGDLVKGSKGTAILEHSGFLYLIVFYEKDIKSYPIWLSRY